MDKHQVKQSLFRFMVDFIMNYNPRNIIWIVTWLFSDANDPEWAGLVVALDYLMSPFIFFVQNLQRPSLIHAMIITLLMNPGETYGKAPISTLVMMTLLLNGAAGIGCIWMEKVPRCLSGVRVMWDVEVKLHCLSTVLIQHLRMEWWPVKSWGLMHGIGGIGGFPISVAPTIPHPSESKPVQEIITSMNLSNPSYHPPSLCTVQVQYSVLSFGFLMSR